jgi:predicted transcriptional regulator
MTTTDYNLSLTPSPNLRTKTLIRLLKGEKKLDDLRKDLRVGSTTVSHTLRELEEYKLIYQDAERNYALTTIGEIVVRKLIDFNDVAETLHAFENFWLTYDLSAIPDNLIDKLGQLKDSRIISGIPVLVFKAYETVIDLLRNAKEIKVVSSILIPDIKLLFDMLVTEKDMRIILTADVLSPSIEAVGLEQVRNAFEKNFKLHVLRQNLRIGFFAVTDRFMALVPYRSDGTFDWSSDLLSCNKTGIDWGLALFNYYNELAESVDLS